MRGPLAPWRVSRLLALGALLLACAAPLLAWTAPARASLPTFDDVRQAWRPSEAQLLDRHGALLHELRIDYRARRGDWTPLAALSPALLAAVLHAEDRRFFRHAGVDWLAAGKAALTNWLSDKPRGASTISMQLAALLDPAHRAADGRRAVAEKWRQMEAARALERTWRKADILEAYLNLVPLRGELVGIDAAARGLFDKRPAGLGDVEALIIAALIRAPNASPAEVARRVCAQAADLPNLPDCARLRARTLNVIDLTPKHRHPARHTALEHEQDSGAHAAAHPTTERRASAAVGGRYPIVPAARQAPHLAHRLLAGTGADTGARVLRTSLDAAVQRHAHTTLAQQLAYLAPRGARDAAALVLDNASGEVLAYVSLSAPDSTSPLSDGVRAARQAGSTLKPLLYALAFDRRLLTAASLLEDAPLTLAGGAGEYAPANYEPAFRGLVSARVALAGSLNVPAVRTLQLVGLDPFIERLGRLGFTGIDEDADWYGYPLALGGLDVRLEELTNAYRALANGGRLSPIRFSPAAADARAPQGERVYSAEAAWLIGDILADRQARAITFGLENPLATRFWSAVKTGTSKDMRDNWAVGWSERYTVGVWVGNFDGAPMRDVSGVSGAAPAWAALMTALHETQPSRQPPPPRGLARHAIAPPGGAPQSEWFLRDTQPRAAAWRPATPPAQIATPTDGALFALDPDIPTTRQQLRFAARHAPPDARWWLDDQPLEAPTWPLTRGRHELLLRNAAGQELDRVRFEVR